MSRLSAIGTLAVMVFALGGCHIVDRERHVAESGRVLSSADVNSIRVGQTTGDELVQSFGAPSSRIDRPDGTSTWKWCQSRTESSSGHVLLLWDRDNSRTTTKCTSVELRAGVVAAVHNE